MKERERLKIFGMEVPIVEIRIFVIVGLLMLFGPRLFTLILGYNTFEKTGTMGDTFGGLTGPFLSYFGSILVYLALKAQIEANNKITQQFEEQNTDQLFFRVFDNFKELRSNALHRPTPEFDPLEGNEAIKQLALDFQFHIENGYLMDFSLFILENDIQDVNDNLLKGIADNVVPYSLIDKKPKFDANSFIDQMKNQPNQQRADFIITMHVDYQSSNQKNLKAMINGTPVSSSFYESIEKVGRIRFYNYHFEQRFEIYHFAAINFMKRRKDEIQGLLNTIEYLFKIIRESKNKKFYFDYLFYNLMEAEKIILFFMLLHNSMDTNFKKDLIAFFNHFEVHFSSEYFFENPSDKMVKVEIDEMLEYINSL